MGRSIGMCIKCGDTYPSDEGPLCACKNENDWKDRALKAEAERDEAISAIRIVSSAYLHQLKLAETHILPGLVEAIGDADAFLARMDKERDGG